MYHCFPLFRSGLCYLLVTVCLLSKSLSAQTLSLGALAFTGYNTDIDPNDTRQGTDFSFVLLTSVPAGQVVSFTDRGWLSGGGFRSGEGTLTLTFDATYLCASEFRVYEEDNIWKVSYLSGSGNPTLSEHGDFSLSSNGDQIFAFSGTDEPTAAEQSAFIAALQMAGNWQDGATSTVNSAQPSSFANTPGHDFVVEPHADNGKYDCFINAGEADALRADLYDLSNWGFTDASTERFDLSNPCTFFCQGNCVAANITSITVNNNENTFCLGDSIFFTIEGNLNSASLWSLYTGGCATEQLATSSSNTIRWVAEKSGIFHIGGIGGCVSNPVCLSIEVIVLGTAANAGPDQKLAAGTVSTTLQGNTPAGGTGTWHLVEEGDGNGIITDPSSPSSTFSGSSGQRYTLAWSIVTPDCANQSSDTVAISFFKPTDLQLGELAFLSYSADQDDFSFVILTDIEAGTSIHFTDRGWLPEGGFRSGEGDLQITFCGPYPCGSQFHVSDAAQEVKDIHGNIVGSVSGTPLDLSTSGDQIFAYQGKVPNADDQSSFVAAIQMNGGWDTAEVGTVESHKPDVFTDGLNSLAIVPEVDNASYACNEPGPADPSQSQVLVNNANNWLGDDDEVPDVPIDCVLRCCSDFVITRIVPSQPGPYCVGDLITLSIDGPLNGAAEWVWYEQACGSGLAIGSGDSLSYKVSSSNLLFVRGEGGCADLPTSCTPVQLPLEDTAPIARCQDLTISLGETFSVADIDKGSSDNCPDFTLSLDVDTLDCTSLGTNKVILRIEDLSGQRDSCAAVITVMGEDEDCDGVDDICDACPSGDDLIDTNENGIPDCTEILAPEQIVETWRCGPELDRIFFCSIQDEDPGSAQTKCIEPSELEAELSAGGYLGPCGQTPCGSITSAVDLGQIMAIKVFPNPVREELIIELPEMSNSPLQLRLYNSLGELIHLPKIPSSSSRRITIPLQGLSAGLYVLMLRNGSKQLTRKKILVLE